MLRYIYTSVIAGKKMADKSLQNYRKRAVTFRAFIVFLGENFVKVIRTESIELNKLNMTREYFLRIFKMVKLLIIFRRSVSSVFSYALPVERKNSSRIQMCRVQQATREESRCHGGQLRVSKKKVGVNFPTEEKEPGRVP